MKLEKAFKKLMKQTEKRLSKPIILQKVKEIEVNGHTPMDLGSRVMKKLSKQFMDQNNEDEY